MRACIRSAARFAVAAPLAVVVFGCGGTTAPKDTTDVAQQYVSEVLQIMETRSINRRAIDWSDFRSRVEAEASSAHTIANTYPAILLALQLLGDNHSSYIGVLGTVLYAGSGCSRAAAPLPAVPQNIGYVAAGSCCTGGTSPEAYADSIQGLIKASDNPQLTGWIVDLRGNTGGNMWPMIAGLGPILGDGPAGYFVDPNGVANRWGYSAGASSLDEQVEVRVSSPYQLRRQNPKVAVLTNELVASSGEAAVIAFRQRPNTRSFGGQTCGKSTANATIGLSDGATLFLTVSTMADRTRTTYGAAVVPDEVISDPLQAVLRAVEWLGN